jgi:hypothetical protein
MARSPAVERAVSASGREPEGLRKTQPILVNLSSHSGVIRTGGSAFA